MDMELKIFGFILRNDTIEEIYTRKGLSKLIKEQYGEEGYMVEMIEADKIRRRYNAGR